MTRARPIFVREDLSSEEDDDEEYYSDETENYDVINISKSSRTIKERKKNKVVAINTDDETGLDEKEIDKEDVSLNNNNYNEASDAIYDSYPDDNGAESDSGAASVFDTAVNTNDLNTQSEMTIPKKIHKLDYYWPHPLETTEPENKDLLYLYNVNDVYISPCDHCQGDSMEYFEITFYYKYSESDQELVVHFDKHPAALIKFMEKNDPTAANTTIPRIMLLAKPACCPKANTSPIYENMRSSLNPSSGIRFFHQNGKIHVYLKVDPASIALIPKCIDLRVNQELEKTYNDSFQLHYKSYGNADALSDTFDFPEAKIAPGFRLNLRSYQLRTICWMKNVEAVECNESNVINNNYRNVGDECHMKIKVGETPYYVEFNGSRNVTKSPETIKLEPLKIYGGILADDTGSGKTVTTIGLIHSVPLTPEKEEVRRGRFRNLLNYMQSRASLIVCPSNILKQWTSEAKRCNPKLKVFGLSTILDHRKISWQDVIDADIVVISYQFLLNTNYLKFKKGNLFNIISEMCDFANLKGRVDLHKLHYHRLILDEFHELESAGKEVKEFVHTFQADYVWGLTGTPSLKNLADQFDYFNLPDRLIKLHRNNGYANSEFRHKFIKRNVPNLQLPPIELETVWINLSANEMALLAWKGREASVKEEIMLCSHYQLSEKGTVPVEAFVSVEDAQISMSLKKGQEIDRLKKSMNGLQSQIDKMLEANPESSSAYDITQLKQRLKESKVQLKSAESGYNYFQNVFKIINEPEKYHCSICYEKISGENLSILPCSHLYCYGCIKVPVEKNNACPLCNHQTKIDEIYRIRVKEPKVIHNLFSANIDTSKYGSKLIRLYRYITDLIETSAEARIILFLQYRDLAEFMAESFKELHIKYVRVAGNVFQRQNAINKFRDSKDIRLIMMSSEDSVSGINLTQATHVILLHPFHTGMGEQADLAYEKQGISRAYRFGLHHPLKVVRFAARGTIEEKITLQRENIRL